MDRCTGHFENCTLLFALWQIKHRHHRLQNMQAIVFLGVLLLAQLIVFPRNRWPLAATACCPFRCSRALTESLRTKSKSSHGCEAPATSFQTAVGDHLRWHLHRKHCTLHCATCKTWLKLDRYTKRDTITTCTAGHLKMNEKKNSFTVMGVCFYPSHVLVPTVGGIRDESAFPLKSRNEIKLEYYFGCCPRRVLLPIPGRW